MKIRNIIISAFTLICTGFGLMMAQSSDPKPRIVTILGKSFYYYETTKGESLEEIARRYDWNLTELQKTNSEVSGNPSAGTLLYYPVKKEADSSWDSKKSNAVESSHIHVARSGETAYGIAKLYNIPLDTLYALNPELINGLKKGDKIQIKQSASLSQGTAYSETDATRHSPETSILLRDVNKEDKSKLESGYIYHTVSDGESLYGIAHKYSTTIEDLFKLNPGLTAGNPEAGEIIRILPESFTPEVHKEVVEEKNVGSFREYKAKRGDSLESIAEANNIQVNELMAANPGVSKIAKGDKVRIPIIEITKVEKDIPVEDPRIHSSEGVEEIYKEVHAYKNTETSTTIGGSASDRPQVGIAIVLTDIGQTPEEVRTKKNKEMEFSRGAIKAMDDLKNNPFRTRLTIIDGNISTDSIKMMLNDFHPSLIVNTSPSNVPDYLINYVDSTSVKLLNAFYVKDEAYVNNPNIIQFLTPSSYMNSNVAEYFATSYPDCKLIVAGSPDPSDHLGNQIIRTFAERGADRVEEIPIEELENAELDNEEGKYLIYGTPSARADILELLKKGSALRDRYVLADIKMIGRPNWLPFATSTKDVEFSELIGVNRVMLPSRFYFNPDEYATKKFIDEYKEIFGLGPMKASPVYCATAYDIMTYFVPNIATHNGDFNEVFTNISTLQSPIMLDRMSNWGGIINKGAYVINFQPFGVTDKVVVPAP